MKVVLIAQSGSKQDLLYPQSEELLLRKKKSQHKSFDTFHMYCWNLPEARVKTANFLRSTADFLSPMERPIKDKTKQR